MTREHYMPLHSEINFNRPDIGELHDGKSLVIRIRDEDDQGVNVSFHDFLVYRKRDESDALEKWWRVFTS